jgi:hypothetical protein|nr:MAG: hypothetical protein [Bacteriophage sp.]
MIDYSNCDMTIDELSAQSNVSKEELITDIAKKYNKSVIEVNNWIKIGKGNIKVAIDILEGLSKYKRNDDTDHEIKAVNWDKYHVLMKKNKEEKNESEVHDNKFEKAKEGVINWDKYLNHDQNGVSDETKKIAEMLNSNAKGWEDFFNPKYTSDLKKDIATKVFEGKCSYDDVLKDDFQKTSDDVNSLKFLKNSKQYFEPVDDKLDDSESKDIVSQVKRKKYVMSQKNETSPVYLKMDNGELIGPFYHNKNHEKTALDAFSKEMMYSEIRDLIKKYPNIEDIIKEVREELTKKHQENIINEGTVYTTEEVFNMKKDKSAFDKVDLKRSKEIMDANSINKGVKVYSNDELYQMIENLTTEVNALATEIGVKLNPYSSINEQSDTKQNLKEIVLKIIEKL